ncbi:MAG: HPP family protein, partial [Anaerolineaceae bacterium]
VSLLMGRLYLFPSLGPSAYLQAENPAHPSTRFVNTVVGHLIGILSGFAGVFLFNAMNDPVALQEKQLTAGRMGAAVVAIALTLLICLLLKMTHPPASATTLLVALGSIKTLMDAINVMIGVVIIAVLGELLRRVRLGSISARTAVEAKVPANAGK